MKAPGAVSPSGLVLVAANLVPLFGVAFLGWGVVALLALFWIENLVIGVLNVLRMICADRRATLTHLEPREAAVWANKAFLVPFFCLHYGMFIWVHGAFVFSIFGGGKYDVEVFGLPETAARAMADFGLWLPAAVLAASHLFSFCWNYLYRGELRHARLPELMLRPYVRVLLLHITLLAGGLAAMRLGSPLWALVVLLGLKMALDWMAHVKEHSGLK